MLAVRVGPEDGVIMETLSEQSLVDHCVIVDGPNAQQQRGGDAVTSTSNDAQESDSPTNVVTTAHDFSQPVTRIIYHHGGTATTSALLVGQQIIQQHHSANILQDDGEDESGLLEEQSLSPQQHPHSLHAHHHHHFKTEEDEMQAHTALITASGVVMSEESNDDLVDSKHLHRMHLLHQATNAENSDTVYHTDDLEAEVEEAHHVQQQHHHVTHSSHHHHHFSHPAQHQMEVECEDFDKDSEHERHHHIHHQPHILSTRLSSGNGIMLTEGGSSEHRVRDTLGEADGVCTIEHGSGGTSNPTIIISSSSANGNSMSTTTVAKPSTLTGSSEVGGRGSAQHWLSANTPAALIENGSSNNTRLVVVTSNPSSVQQTLTLHRIVTQVKHELIQTAAEDLSLSNNNNNHSRNNHNNNNSGNSGSSRSSSSSRTQHQQQPAQSSISPLIISQGRLSASGPTGVPAAALRGQELTVIVGRQPVFSQELQAHQQQQQHQQEQDSDVSNNTEEQQSMGCGQQTQHLHHTHHQHQQHHHGHHNHHPHQNHVEEVEEEEEEPNSPSNTTTDGHIETDRVSMSSMIDASEFRALHAAATAEHSYQVALTTVHNGRLSPTGFSPGTSTASQYATLTPLQPLPPISTMTDKFSYGHAAGNVAGSFTVMQHNGLAGLALATNPYSNYEKLPPMCVSPPHHYSTSPVNGLSSDHQSNGMRSEDMSSPPPKSPANNGYSPTSFSSPNDQSNRTQRNTPSLSPSPLQSSSNNHPPANNPSHHSAHHQHHHHHSTGMLIHPHQQSTVVSSITSNGVGSPNSSTHSSPPLATAVVVAHRDASSPVRSSPPLSVVLSGASTSHPHISHTQSVGTVLSSVSVKQQQQQSVVSVVSSSVSPGGVVTLTSTPAGSAGSISSAGSTGGELEEINTKELAARISAELKRYSIPQAIFAQRVLCRSQGTLSDLLRNPKPWSKLKSGRETFRRMWKWLQEPEFQRMSALRLAGKPALSSSSPSFTPPSCVSSASSNVTFSASANPTSSLENDHHVSLLLYQPHGPMSGSGNMFAACKRKEEQQTQPEATPAPKKPRLVFTDLQRRTLQAIFKETKRPSKEMQVTIARQLGLEPTTVGNFFMNARRRSMDKWKEETDPTAGPMHKGGGNSAGSSNSSAASNSPSSSLSGQSGAQAQVVTVHHTPTTIIAQHGGGASLDNQDANL